MVEAIGTATRIAAEGEKVELSAVRRLTMRTYGVDVGGGHGGVGFVWVFCGGGGGGGWVVLLSRIHDCGSTNIRYGWLVSSAVTNQLSGSTVVVTPPQPAQISIEASSLG